MNASESHPCPWSLATWGTVALCFCLFITTAGTNISTFFLLLVSPWVWYAVKDEVVVGPSERVMFGLVGALCALDVGLNLAAGHTLWESLRALTKLRNFWLLLPLWPIFARADISRQALAILVGMVTVLATINLGLRIAQHPDPAGQYYIQSEGADMYAQVIVGMMFLLAQLMFVRPQWRRGLAIAMALMLLSLMFASLRRTGYAMLLGGFVVWLWLNRTRLDLRLLKWLLPSSVLALVVFYFASSVLQERVALVAQEVQLFLSQSPMERLNNDTSVGTRLQYYLNAWQLVQAHGLMGVGSLEFPKYFRAFYESANSTFHSTHDNPHNEYLYMWVTHGIGGLGLYLAIWVQACRIAWRKTDSVQRIGLVMFVVLFMMSITTNSMMIDMIEGHFAMLVLLIFVAPTRLGLEPNHTKNGSETC